MFKCVILILSIFFSYCNSPNDSNQPAQGTLGTSGNWKMVYEYTYNLNGQDLKWPFIIDTLPYRIDYPTAKASTYLSVSDTALLIYTQNDQCLNTLHVGLLKINDSLFNSSDCMSNPKLKEFIYLLKGDTLLYNWVDVSNCESNAGYDSTNLGVYLSKMYFVRYNGLIPILNYPECN